VIRYHDQPVPCFSIPPNWRNNVQVSEDWGVFVRESLDASETRRGSSPRPRYLVEYATLTLSGQEQGYIRKVMERADVMPIALGLWEDEARCSIEAIAGTPWIDVETTAGTLFGVVPYVMIWGAFNSFELHRVSGVNATQIQVTGALENDWPVGTRVVPVAVGKLAKPKTTALTDINDVFRVRFEEVWLNEGPMLCGMTEGEQQGATLPFETECIGGAIL
jgi:hypothetical protein